MRAHADCLADLLCPPRFLRSSTDTFVKMGAGLDRISVLALGSQSIAQVLEQFGRFRVQAAECFLEADKQRLLSIIESGFGEFNSFNCLVRTLLVARLVNVDAGAP